MVEKGVGTALRLEGVAASGGVAIGPVFVHGAEEFKPDRETKSEGTAEEELDRFYQAVEIVVPQLSETAEKLREGGNEDEAAIFHAHIALARTRSS